ncbi:hypothetical protein FHL15_006184 [Xylaria flabelliformis]|uniref:GAR domain-containing protein n=1 Tax=Xylaria flabelliformis TaxID=2512241 RepID=A0A553HYM0_9PEZI|nr:hypothetical protein FHL15_006184 [Xylaria flabelliformis]
MSEPHLSTPAGPRSTLRARPPPLRTTSPSPARQQHSPDDLLSQLKPATAFEALQSPAGPLKECLERASVSEQAFALKTAIASQTIHNWLGELSDWPWPSTSTSAGFEIPLPTRKELFESKAAGGLPEATLPSDVTYYGSLPADDVIRYEKRIEEINQDMEGLDLEDIKNQVLHNHILPLSRPGTPFSDAGLSVASAFSFAKMEDLTAVVTAITVRTLPALSKLSKLLHTWNIRLVVLRKVPSLVVMIMDAEVALRSGWSAIGLPSRGSSDSTEGKNHIRSSTLSISQKDLDVMKTVLQQKVARPGRDLDFMLDMLEGMVDTLPEEWIDRMEFIEREYADWVTTAERKRRESECSNLSMNGNTKRISLPQTPRPNIQIQDESPTKMPISPGFSDYEPLEEEDRESWAVRILADQSSKGAIPKVNGPLKHTADQRVIEFGDWLKGSELNRGKSSNKAVSPKSNDQNSSAVSSSAARTITIKEPPNSTYDGSEDVEDDEGVYHEPRQNVILSEVNRNIVRQPANQLLKPPFEEDFEPSILESVNEEEEEPELPPTYFELRKRSDPSVTSVATHGSSNYSPDYFGRGAFREASMEPELPNLPDPDQPFSSDAISPPSSPPLRYTKPRSTSVTFKDIPEIAPLPEVDRSPPRTPLEPPEVFDPDASFEWDSQLGSPSRMSIISTINDDDHLQKQLRELLETIPAKIELKKRGINLNPPDLQLPSRPKPRYPDSSRRPTSALSSRGESRMGTPSYSRSVTPSFMLAPVRDTRQRSTSSQGIRLYHLSRSGEVPIKLFIRCVGEQNERVMVRVGGGWSDLGEYLRDYAIHHGSRSKGEGKVEVTDAVRTGSSPASRPTSRPNSALGSPMTPLAIRKTRRNLGEEGMPKAPRTPLSKASALQENANTPASEASVRSRASSHIDWDEEDSSLGLAGPKAARRREISDESRAWIENVKHKVRLASGERLTASASSEQLRPSQPSQANGRQRKSLGGFGEIGKVGSTKRLFRKN